MIICNNCGRENEEEFKFCLGCGSPLSKPKPDPEPEPVTPAMIDCPHCGAKVPGGFKFCGACGGSLAGASSPASTSSPAQTVQSGGPVHRDVAARPEPAARSLGKLTVIQPDGSEGARIPITTDGVTLGRKSTFPVLANDPFLSPNHAEIIYEGGELLLRDLESTNGIFWRLRDDIELTDGDLIRVGQELLRFQRFDALSPLIPGDYDKETRLQGSPASEVWGRLSLLGGPDDETRAFILSGNEATIGREIGSVLFRDDGFVSGKHARIYKDKDKIFLRDLGSSNGSYIKIRKSRPVVDGDQILMGQQLFRVSLS